MGMLKQVRMRCSLATLAIAVMSAAPVLAQTAITSGWKELAAIPPATGLIHGSVINNNADPCCEAVSMAPLEAGPDAAVIETMRNRAFRMGPVLWLKLVGDRSLRIVDPRPRGFDCHDYEVCRVHLLAAWWDRQRYYVVDVRRHEGRQAYLVSELDGSVSLVFAPPVLSPSRRYAIAADTDPAYGNGLQLIDMTSRQPKVLEVTSRPACPGKKAHFLRPDPVWRDDFTIGFEGTTFPGDHPEAKQVLRTINGNPQWEC